MGGLRLPYSLSLTSLKRDTKQKDMIAELKQVASEFCQFGKEYYEMKQAHPDAILLLRDGDYYFTFGQDATDCSKILMLNANRLDMTMVFTFIYFPAPALDTYLPRIVRGGRRVAICEKLEKAEGV